MKRVSDLWIIGLTHSQLMLSFIKIIIHIIIHSLQDFIIYQTSGIVHGYLLFSIGSMGESCAGMKVDHSISIGKYAWVLKGMSIKDFNNTKHDFFHIFLYLLNEFNSLTPLVLCTMSVFILDSSCTKGSYNCHIMHITGSMTGFYTLYRK